MQKDFRNRSFIAYRRNINLHQLIGDNRIFKNRVVRKNAKQPQQSGHCSPCPPRMNNFYCEVKQTKTFQSYRAKETNLSNISQSYMQKSKSNLFTPLPYMPTSVRWKK